MGRVIVLGRSSVGALTLAPAVDGDGERLPPVLVPFFFLLGDVDFFTLSKFVIRSWDHVLQCVS